MTTHLWTWDGAYFGYRDGDDLWTHGGVLAGRFHGNEVYAIDGHYLGEVTDDRLLSDVNKSGRRQAPTAPRHGAAVGAHGPLGNRGMPGGFKAFPKPESFH